MSQPATVLVVDDDLDIVDTMRDILEEEGHVVRCAHNGNDALAAVFDERPDVVLLDLDMPGSDGRTFLREIARHRSFDDLVVVVLSGAPDAHTLSREAISKPLRLDTLIELIDRVAKRPSHGEPRSSPSVGSSRTAAARDLGRSAGRRGSRSAPQRSVITARASASAESSPLESTSPLDTRQDTRQETRAETHVQISSSAPQRGEVSD